MVSCSCSSLDLITNESLIAGKTEAWLVSVELGSEGTGVAAVTCVAKETGSAFLFYKIQQTHNC